MNKHLSYRHDSYCFQIATLIAVYANWGFARIQGIGWGWAGVVWLYSIVFYIPLDVIKFATRYFLSGKAWSNLENKVICTFPITYPFMFIYQILSSPFSMD